LNTGATLLAILGSLSIGRAWADAPAWGLDTVIKDVTRLAAQVDLRDTQAVGHALGVKISMRAYCGQRICEGQAATGVLHAFPDPLLSVSGSAGLKAQIYVPSPLNPPDGGMPRVGTLAVLDVFLPDRGVCLSRSDIRAALGKEAFRGSTLGLGEPLDVALNYVIRREPGFRTILEFVFAGKISANGCLAFISVREDNFGLPQPLRPRSVKNTSSLTNPFNDDEDAIDYSGPRALFDPSADDSPLGLTLGEFSARYPACKLNAPEAVEEISPLTDIPPPSIPLLPVTGGAYLATDHSIWGTDMHGTGRTPAIDATLITRTRVTCTAPNPDAKFDYDKLRFQNYQILVFDQHILAVIIISQERGVYVPAPIEAAEVTAQSGGTNSSLATFEFPPQTYNANRPAVFGLSMQARSINLVEALGPVRHRSNLLETSAATDVFIDRPLWDRYATLVRATLSKLRRGLPATAVSESIKPVRPPAVASPTPAGPADFLHRIHGFLAKGDVGNAAEFGRAMGGRPLLLSNGFIQNAVAEDSPAAYTVGLMPGPTRLDGLGFQYQIVPTQSPDMSHRLPPYHRLLAQIDIGNWQRKLDQRYCLTRADLEAEFGPDQMEDFRQRSTYVHKFQSTPHPGDTIYASFTFDRPFFGQAQPPAACASYMSLSQYRLIRP